MSEVKTEITEVITGLGMLGENELDCALNSKPAALENVSDEKWSMLRSCYSKGIHKDLFQLSFQNGQHFLRSDDGLRNKIPFRIEWKGNHRGPAFELVPADLRIDRVYLVSCKFFSKILLNPGPEHLFKECLRIRPLKSRGKDWFAFTGGRKYEDLYQQTRDWLRKERIFIKSETTDISPEDRVIIKNTFKKEEWPETLLEPYRELCSEVSTNSARILNSNLKKKNQKLEFFWRLIRLQAAPYFLLGSFKEKGITKPLRLRIDTPWDWNNEFKLDLFEAREKVEKGQPTVEWKAVVRNKDEDKQFEVVGHIEIRWSHGKFCGNPEAKVYLDSPHEKVPGYWKLA